MKRAQITRLICRLGLLATFSTVATAQTPYPTVANAALLMVDTDGSRTVQLDLTWAGSWRTNAGPSNWDAAWVFAKYRQAGGARAFRHATLSTNTTDFSVARDNGLSATFTSVPDGRGVFIHRMQEGAGTNDWRGIHLCWKAPRDGVAADTKVELRLYALAMVYVPPGEFFVGDGASAGRFHAGGAPQKPYRVTKRPVEFRDAPGGLWADRTRTALPNGSPGPEPWDSPSGSLPPAFPTGTRGFYVMKFEITQGEYATFLNSLETTQAAGRFPTASDYSGVRSVPDNYRHAISNVAGVYIASAPTRANNWMNWEDGIAFCDWAGLRPMSELEFEKACRGPLAPVAGEYAWGTTNIGAIQQIVGVDGSGEETAQPTNANTHYARTISGPVRAGLHGGKHNRELRGESYYGVHDLSGNAVEMAVNISSAAGRSFCGEHGDGKLAEDGRSSDVPSWPRIPVSPQGAFSPAYGFGYRGGDFWNPELDLRVSVRNVARFSGTRRLFGLGFRGARTAPDP